MVPPVETNAKPAAGAQESERKNARRVRGYWVTKKNGILQEPNEVMFPLSREGGRWSRNQERSSKGFGGWGTTEQWEGTEGWGGEITVKRKGSLGGESAGTPVRGRKRERSERRV